ncbi:MAG: radical SAM protein [Syntrophomonadaceae bacterium]|nr:radical SAM protein [Syntrophomonadaceae bacterium]
METGVLDLFSAVCCILNLPNTYLYTNVVSTSRGCPNRCSFCYNSCTNRLYAQRPVSNVINDINTLGTRHILFIDDNFIGNPKYTHELLSKISGMNLIWSAAVTANILDFPDLLDLMAKTGCRSLFIGFESINTASLESINKDNKVNRYEELVEAIHSRGIMINASMVFGLDGDDKDTFKHTLDWLVRMRIETLTSHILTPYPGTELHRRMDAAGRITDYDLGKYNTSNVVFKPLGMTADELYKGYRWMYKQFYSFENIIRRFPKSKAQNRSYLLFNLFYRKFGRFTSTIAHFVPMGVLGKLAAKISYKV